MQDSLHWSSEEPAATTITVGDDVWVVEVARNDTERSTELYIVPEKPTIKQLKRLALLSCGVKNKKKFKKKFGGAPLWTLDEADTHMMVTLSGLTDAYVTAEICDVWESLRTKWLVD